MFCMPNNLKITTQQDDTSSTYVFPPVNLDWQPRRKWNLEKKSPDKSERKIIHKFAKLGMQSNQPTRRREIDPLCYLGINPTTLSFLSLVVVTCLDSRLSELTPDLTPVRLICDTDRLLKNVAHFPRGNLTSF